MTTEIPIEIKELDGEMVIMFPDGDAFPITAPMHQFLFHLKVLSPVVPEWDGRSFKVILPGGEKAARSLFGPDIDTTSNWVNSDGSPWATKEMQK